MKIMRDNFNQVAGLLNLIDSLPLHCTMVEIGCYSGESTAMFAARFDQVIAIDPWAPWPGMAEGEIERAELVFDLRIKGLPVVKVKHRAEDVAPLIEDRSLDFVYIDANHDYLSVMNDIDFWLPKVKMGGAIGGHDFCEAPWTAVPKAVTARFGMPHIFQDTSWMVRL